MRPRVLVAPHPRGFEPEYLASDPWLARAEFERRNLESVPLEELFTRSDFVFVLDLPTPDNHQMVSRELMNRLQPHQATPQLISRLRGAERR